jgi:hypothetical protein
MSKNPYIFRVEKMTWEEREREGEWEREGWWGKVVLVIVDLRSVWTCEHCRRWIGWCVCVLVYQNIFVSDESRSWWVLLSLITLPLFYNDKNLPHKIYKPCFSFLFLQFHLQYFFMGESYFWNRTSLTGRPVTRLTRAWDRSGSK